MTKKIPKINDLFSQGSKSFNNALGFKKESLDSCIELQKELNEFMVPEWRKKNLNFKLAAIIENVELLDSFNWKWWKKTETDWENIEIELVDLFHFLISIAIVNNLEPLFTTFFSAEEAKYRYSDKIVPKRNDKLQSEIINKMSTTFNSALSSDIYPLAIQTFIECWFLIGGTSESLFRKYKMKNVLNKFRKNHGYKEGTYIKIWNGKEDNIFALNVQEKLEDDDKFMDNLYNKLEEEYKKVELNNEDEDEEEISLSDFITTNAKYIDLFAKIDKSLHSSLLVMLDEYKRT